MADEKQNTGQGEQIKLDIPDAPPAPDLTDGAPPAPEPGDVVVDVGKIDELMAKRRAAAREAVEQEADLPGEGEQVFDAPGPTDKGDVPPAPEQGAPPEPDKEPKEPPQADADLEEGQKKPRRGRPPKDKDGSETEKPKRGRKPKDKAAPDQDKAAKGQRDKVSQSKAGKAAPEQPNVHQFIISPIEAHSKKPDEARDKIVSLMGDVPRVELFARQTPPGWDVWGNEVEPTGKLRSFGAPAKSNDFVGKGGATEHGELWDKMSRSEYSEVCADESQRKGGD